MLIAASEFITPLGQRFDPGGGDLLTFTDTDALRALSAIEDRRPSIVVLEQRFAETSRGNAIIDRLRTDPSLIGPEIRIITCDEKEAGAGPDASTPARAGIRRLERFHVDEFVEAMVDGNLADVIDLSANGAQVVSTATLKPNQRVQVSLSDGEAVLHLNACVAWSSFEIPPTGGPRYRAGIEFLDAEAEVLSKYSTRHKA